MGVCHRDIQTKRSHRASRGAAGLRMKDKSVFTERGSVTVAK